jgi:hypothetical protein
MVRNTIYSYPDQLLSEQWAEWSDSVLNRIHGEHLSIGTGFQEAINATTAGPRTRAIELFDIGLLRGPLVSPQGVGRDVIPFGWGLVQEDNNVHTSLGFLSYAVGNAIRMGVDNDQVRKAFSALCSIYLLQLGEIFEGKCFLTLTLFERVLEAFRKPDDITQGNWNRYVASGIFCSLHNDGLKEEMLNRFFNGEEINTICIVDSDETINRLSAEDLEHWVREKRSITSITPPKSALFWVGALDDDSPRGVYSVARESGYEFLLAVADFEFSVLITGQESPFRNYLEKPLNSDIECVISELNKMLATNMRIKNLWENQMETLYNGVIHSLRFIEENVSEKIKSVFYVHDDIVEVVDEEELIMSVGEENIYKKPEIGDLIVWGRLGFIIQGFELEDQLYRLTLIRE